MPQYTLDLSGYKPNISDTVPDGRYLAIVEDYELGKSKAGNDMFTVWLRIIEGPQTGNVIIDRLTVTQKALFKIVGFLNGLGQPTPKRRLSIDPQRWLNKKVYIDTSKAEPYRGRPGTSQVDGYARWVAPETESEDAPVDEVVPDPQESASASTQQSETTSVDSGSTSPGVTSDEPMKEFTTSTPAEDDAPATATPAKAEPETLSLADINL